MTATARLDTVWFYDLNGECLQEPVWFKAGAQIFTGEGIKYLGAFTIPAFSSNILVTLGTEVYRAHTP